MRLLVPLFIAAMVAGTVAFSSGVGADEASAGRLAAVSAVAPLGSSGSASMSVDTPQSVEPAAPVVREPQPAPRWSRRYRRRNRYWLDMPYHPGNWAPPEGPVRIALQAGHWRADEAPDELRGLRNAGARANGKAEWEVNLVIAREAAAMLEQMGYVVDVLPAVVPPQYRAHLFISIHADGSADPRATGYRVAAPRRDVTGRADRMADLLERSYGEATGLDRLPSATRRMRNYYAFNYRRYRHALHPLTIGVILETGFLTSASDRRVIVDDPSRAARGIVAAVTRFPETPPPIGAADVDAGGGSGTASRATASGGAGG